MPSTAWEWNVAFVPVLVDSETKRAAPDLKKRQPERDMAVNAKNNGLRACYIFPQCQQMSISRSPPGPLV